MARPNPGAAVARTGAGPALALAGAGGPASYATKSGAVLPLPLPCFAARAFGFFFLRCVTMHSRTTIRKSAPPAMAMTGSMSSSPSSSLGFSAAPAAPSLPPPLVIPDGTLVAGARVGRELTGALVALVGRGVGSVGAFAGGVAVGIAVGVAVGSDVLGAAIGDMLGSDVIGATVGDKVGFEVAGAAVCDAVGSEVVGAIDGDKEGHRGPSGDKV